MARQDIAGIFKSAVLGATLVAGSAFAAQAQALVPGEQAISPFAGGSNQLELSATATFTTDYIFRGVSFSDQKPAIQGSFDATYGVFYLGMWGSSTTVGDSIEIDYYGGITPSWAGFDFDVGVVWFTWPGASGIDLVEIKSGVSRTFGNLTVGVANYWETQSVYDVLEGSAEYALGEWFNFFDASVGGGVGFYWFDDGGDYTYWNAGLTLGFLENWSADIRYWDTDFNDQGCAAYAGSRDFCDGRVVGTISASF
jgi:uncharacterized protein (TIGR02001 family)